jgi:predicted Ser/Thr protein kinase
MAETKTCPKCGAELSPDAPAGICPKCLMQAGLGSQATMDQDPGASTPLTPDERAAATVRPSPRFPTPYLETLARQFPQLEILELLGQGGMGVVYKARQRQLNRLVAVKILPPSVGEDPAFTERFAREAQALAQLNHPNIVQVHDFGRTDEFFYFVMEYVDGVNLRALIREGKLKPEEALRIVPQICEALQFAHDEGIVHRDIKPENILIDKKGRVKIADFGLAKLLGRAAEDLSLTGTGQLMGTLGYMAPEQLQQAHSVDHRADIYSLGVVFYEMLTGQLPIGRFELPSKKVHVDVRLDEIVLRSLESEPDRRYQHAVDVKTDVQVITGEVRHSPRPTDGGAQTAPTSDPEEAHRREELAGRAPGWVELGAFATFLVGWIFLGAMWNLGPIGLAIGIAVLAAFTYVVVRWKVKYLPKLRTELSRQSQVRRGIALICGLVIFSFAVLAVVPAHVKLWDAPDEVLGQARMTAPPDFARGAEARAAFPLDKLEALRTDKADDVHLVPSGRTFDKPMWSGIVEALLAGIVGLVFFACSVAIVISTRLWKGTWKYYWGPSLSVSMLFFAALFPAHIIRLVPMDKNPSSFSVTMSPFPVREIRSPLASSRLDKLLADWAEVNAYEPTQHREWRVSEGGYKPLGQVRMLELRPVSPFDGLHIALGGPVERPLPPLIITCVSTDNPAEAFVSVDAGMITKGTREESTWPAVLDSLEAAIRTGSPGTDGIDRARSNFRASSWLMASAYGGILLVFLIGPGIVRYTSIKNSKTSAERRFLLKQAAFVLTLGLLLGVLPTAMALHGVIMLQANSAAVLLLLAVLLASARWVDWRAARHPTGPTATDATNAVSSQGTGERSHVRTSTLRADGQALPPVAVRIRAIGLIITGVLHAAYGIGMGLFLYNELFFFERLLFLALLADGVVIVVGGMKMLRMQSQSWAITASILALLPVGPGCLLGLPMGIWSLIVLGKPKLKAVFEQKNHEDSSTASDFAKIHRRVSWPATALLIAGILGFAGLFVATLFAMVMLNKSTNVPGGRVVVLNDRDWMLFWGLVSFGLIRSFLLTFAGLQIKQLASYRLAVAGSLVALMPNSSAFLIVWSLIKAGVLWQLSKTHSAGG